MNEAQSLLMVSLGLKTHTLARKLENEYKMFS